MEPLYAEKGEIVRCENGHAVCEMAADVFVGDAWRVLQLKNWQRPGMQNLASGPCSCGSRFFGPHASAGNCLHFHNGWRVNNLPYCNMKKLLLYYT